MKKIINKNKGITLIALVITIVFLIILASVTITLSLGDNGIFRKASKAKEDTKVAQNEESMQIAEVTNSIDEITGSRGTVTLTEEELQKKIDEAVNRATTPEEIPFTETRPSNVKSTTLSLKKIGCICTGYLTCSYLSASSATWYTIGKIDSQYAPNIDMYDSGSNNAENNFQIQICSNGDIKFRTLTTFSTERWFALSFSYVK